MKRGGWIVCERSNRWAAGLRMVAQRRAINGKATSRLVEVRGLTELDAQLAELRTAFVFVEVHTNKLADILVWLANARVSHPHARFFALLNLPPTTPVEQAHDVASVLLEAGAVGVADSPRHLHDVLAMAERHRALVAAESTSFASDQPLVEWAKTLLPWQDA